MPVWWRAVGSFSNRHVSCISCIIIDYIVIASLVLMLALDHMQLSFHTCRSCIVMTWTVAHMMARSATFCNRELPWHMLCFRSSVHSSSERYLTHEGQRGSSRRRQEPGAQTGVSRYPCFPFFGTLGIRWRHSSLSHEWAATFPPAGTGSRVAVQLWRSRSIGALAAAGTSVFWSALVATYQSASYTCG